MKPLPVSDQKIYHDKLLSFAIFGLDRLMPDWVQSDSSMPIIDIGPGTKSIEPLYPKRVIIDWPEYDLDGRGGANYLPYDDDAVGGIFCVNVLEHLWDPRWLINEAARVLAPGCPFNIFVPHPDSIMYKQDLDHKSQFVLDTWDNYLSSMYYDKGRTRPPFHVGVNIKFALKEDNTAIITQLIKE